MRTMRLQQICRELCVEVERLTSKQSEAVIGLPWSQFYSVRSSVEYDLRGAVGGDSFELCGVRFYAVPDRQHIENLINRGEIP